MQSELFQLLYTSVASDHVGDTELRSITDKASKFNATMDITGVLLCGCGRFIQVLEGPEAHVRRLYKRISGDARHRDVELLHSTTGGERYYQNWGMGHLFLEPDKKDQAALNQRFVGQAAEMKDAEAGPELLLDYLETFVRIFGDELDQISLDAFLKDSRPSAA